MGENWTLSNNLTMKVTLIMLAGKTLARETTSVIAITGVRDIAGNALEGEIIRFTTGKRP